MASPMNSGPVHVWIRFPEVHQELRFEAQPFDRIDEMELNRRRLAQDALRVSATQPVARVENRQEIVARRIRQAAEQNARRQTTVTARRQLHYFGTGQRGPRIKIRRAYARIFTDIATADLAHDKAWLGAEALIFVDFTRWNEVVYQMLAAFPRPGAPPGLWRTEDVGKFVAAEGSACTLYLRFPAPDFHPAMRAAQHIVGMRFPATTLEGDDDFETGSAVNIRHVAFHAQCLYAPANETLHLYDFDMTDIPALAPD